MSLDVYAAYLIACIVIIIVPGPTVTLIVANSLKHGTRAGLLNVAGTQAGLAIMIVVAGIGLSSVIAAMGHWFEWLRLAGAAYLIWLGWKMFRAAGAGIEGAAPAKPPRGGFFLQGALVALSNPKMMLFFGAFFPQFLDPTRDHATQIALMGATALAFAALSDGTYAMLSGRAGHLLSQRRVRLMSKFSGSLLIGGGLWLASTRAN
ncbi:LysE family translocator [Bosea sp. AS-1]|jgi:threonine/homoserine/homoserine lactone efflux protein|uniref:LysE family translocator n=1 Tax=Bosea sp. AS-1 TaxID=2015316 RepID=UPI000B76E68A|nr:LysE family translocator [Bosea sp. AS-1]